MRVPLIVCCVLGFAVAMIAGYGYWRVNSHGTIDIHLRDIASQEQYGRIFDARIALLDSSGRQLAAGKTDDKFGIVLIAHPQAGFCGPELQQSQYQKCRRALSAWLMEWAHDVRYVELEFGNCRFQRIPLQLSVFQAGMLTWWVPLPHVGGDPYTMFNAALTVNGKTCTLPDRDQPR